MSKNFPWRPGLRSACEAETALAAPEQCTWLDQEDDFTWQNTGDETVPPGGLVCVFDGEGNPKFLGIAQCMICPGHFGTLLTRFVVRMLLDPDLAAPIPQGTKIYATLKNGKWYATPDVPALGYSVGCAIMDYDMCSEPGMAAIPGDKCVRVHVDCCHVPELFGVTSQDDKAIPADPATP